MTTTHPAPTRGSRNNLGRSAAALMLAASLAALPVAAQQKAGTEDAPAAQPTAGNTVTVLNNLTTPVTIFLDYGDYDRRVGTIPAGGTATLPLPEFALKELPTLQLYAKVEQGFALETHGFRVEPNMKVGWVVTKDLPTKAAGDTIKVKPPAPALAKASLAVSNERDAMVTLYAEDVKLGFVPAHGKASIGIPEGVIAAGKVKVTAHPEGGADLAPQELDVAGESVTMVIAAK
jgi:hypothetical protein